MKKLNNKGFSLVELIIVIAIMVILVVVVAPQYTKFVNNSRVSGDVQTAQTLATAIDIAVSEGSNTFKNDGTLAYTKISGADSMPGSKFNGGSFTVTGNNTDGVSKITLTYETNTYECYPNPDSTGTPKGINNTTANGGLKR